jgi:hypothetical protein
MNVISKLQSLKESFLRRAATTDLLNAHAALQKHESIPIPKRADDHDAVKRKLSVAYDKAKAYHSHATR